MSMVRMLVTLLVVVAVSLSAVVAEEPEIDNNVIPQKDQESFGTESSSSSVTEDKPAVVPSSTAAPAKPAAQDLFARIIDDIIQIPIAALRAVNTLLNNIAQRKPVVVTPPASDASVTPASPAKI